jgi:amidophosphoribosyltransferase
VDTPSKRELIAANKSIEEIRRYIEADSLAYLSLDGLLQCCRGEEKTGYCTACYTGNYPTSGSMWKRSAGGGKFPIELSISVPAG